MIDNHSPDEQLAAQTEPGRTFSAILSDVQAMTGAEVAALYRVDSDAQRVTRVASTSGIGPLQSLNWMPLGVGLVGKCAASGETILSTDMESDERAIHYLSIRRLGLRAMLGVPLCTDVGVVGVIGAIHRQPFYFTEQHVENLQAYAREVGHGLQLLWSWQDQAAALGQSMDPRWLYQMRLERVREFGASIHASNDVEEVFDCALAAMAELTWASHVFIALVDERTQVIKAHRGLNFPADRIERTVQSLHPTGLPDEGALSHVVRTRQPAFIHADVPWPEHEHQTGREATRYTLSVPLIGRGGVLGALSAGWNHDALADPILVGLTSILADHVSAAMETHRLLAVERQQRAVGEELHQVAQRITAGLSLEESLAGVLHAVERLLGATSASVYLVDDDVAIVERRFTTRYTGSPHWEDRRGMIAPEGPTVRAIKTFATVVVEDAAEDPIFRQLDVAGLRTVAATPITHARRVVGVLYANWSERRECGRSDLRLLETLASYGAVAIENARLHAHLVETARIEEANRRAQEAEEARQRLQEFMAMASHDLRGPLTIILGYAQMLGQKRSPRGDSIKTTAAGIEKAARRMRRLIDDLLDAARIGAGRFMLQPTQIDLSELVRQVVDEQRSTSIQHPIELRISDRIEGQFDGQRVSQVLVNLLSNAAKYSPDHQPVLVCLERRGGEAILCVTDRGDGIDSDSLPHLFQPFFRANQDEVTKGTGLGLYIAKGIVESHGGRIWVETESGKGSTFAFSLPLKP